MFRRATLLLASAAAAPPWSAWDTCAKTNARSVSTIFPRHTANEVLATLPPPSTDHPHASDRTPLVLLAPGSQVPAQLSAAEVEAKDQTTTNKNLMIGSNLF